jgi:hypothetical protein
MKERFDYNKFFDEVENALTIHSHDIEKKIYEAPNIHNKILKQFIIERNNLQKLESKWNKIHGDLFHYYRHESDIRCENKDVTLFYVKKDEKFIAIDQELSKQKLLVEAIERWMKKASSIGFDIKNIVEFLKFMSGN